MVRNNFLSEYFLWRFPLCISKAYVSNLFIVIFAVVLRLKEKIRCFILFSQNIVLRISQFACINQEVSENQREVCFIFWNSFVEDEIHILWLNKNSFSFPNLLKEFMQVFSPFRWLIFDSLEQISKLLRSKFLSRNKQINKYFYFAFAVIFKSWAVIFRNLSQNQCTKTIFPLFLSSSWFLQVFNNLTARQKSNLIWF